MLRRSLLSLALIAPLLVPAASLAADPNSAKPASPAVSKNEAAVLEAERGWSTGIAKNDFALLDKTLADDMTYTHSNGHSDTKESYIAKLRAGTMRYFEAEYDGSVRVQLLDSQTALTFGKIKVTTLGANNTQAKATLIFLHAFVKRHGRWQLVAHQSAKM
jgi:ketosteroid isomerase-like protein